jgi:hypothetical protein
MSEPSEEEMQQIWSDACDELVEEGVVRGASCLLCGRVWMVLDTYDGPCIHCFGHPAIAAEITLACEDDEEDQ